MCCFFKTSYSPVFSVMLTSSHESRWFPFSFHIWSAIKKTLHFHLDILLFNFPLTLLLVGGISQFCILYHDCMGWNTCNSWSCFIRLASEEISSESYHFWLLSLYHMDNISFESFKLGLWYKVDRLWWIYEYSQSFNRDFLELMLCTQSSCCDGGCFLNPLFLLDMHHYHC